MDAVGSLDGLLPLDIGCFLFWAMSGEFLVSCERWKHCGNSKECTAIGRMTECCQGER